MKRISVRIAIAACTFIVGVVAASVWLGKSNWLLSHTHPTPAESAHPTPAEPDVPASSEPVAPPDSTAYEVNLCDLVRDSKRYDGKIVRTRAFYVQGVDTSSLDDPACDAWLRPSCAASDEECDKIWARIIGVMRSGRSFRVRVDVVGRYKADVADPIWNQGGAHVHLLEILALKGARPDKARD